MKPLQLKLTAFGSYAEPTLVPFEDLDNGLYLITGDTGAGKTTLFDGIVFALYGVASGKDRTPAMLHSDLADKGVDTRARLTFSQGGKRYTVTRTIHFPKKRKGEGGYGDPDIQATLTGDGLTPVEGASRVTAACEALLGLNAEQFRKIVMLAQGEFRDFLKADSQKKNEILGRLFDSSAYVWYQRLLEGARQRLEALRAGDREALKSLLTHQLVLPPEADPVRFLPDEPRLLEALDGLLAENRTQAAALDRDLRAAQRERDGLLVRQTQGKALNEALDRLAETRNRLEALNAQGPEMDRRRAALDRAETALHRALPPLREAERARRDREAGREALDQLERRAALRAEEFAHAQAARAGDETLAARREELTALTRELDRQLELFSALAAAEAVRARAAADRQGCLDRREALTRSLEAREAQRKALNETLEGLGDAALEADQRLREATEAEGVYAALAGANGVRERYLALADRAKQLEAQWQKYRDYVKRVLEAQDRCNDLYRRFLAGQAGLLAGELRRTVEARGAGCCPVCGAELGPADLDRLAAGQAEVPTQEAVEEARAEAEALEQDRQEKKEKLDRAETQLLSKREMLAKDARALCPDCDGWETLAEPDWLDRAIAQAGLRSAAAREALEAARSRVRTREAARKDLADTERALEALRADLDRARTALTDREKALGAAEGETALLRDQLRWPDEAAARSERVKRKNEYAQVCNLLTAHESRERQAKEALDTVQGQVRHARETLEARTQAAEAAEAAAGAALAETGFADAGAVAQALRPCGGRDPETWVKAEQLALADYDHARQSLGETLAALTEQTADQERADLTALEGAFAQTEETCQDLRRRSRSLGQWLEATDRVRAQAAQRLVALARTDAAWTRLDRLGTLAVGAVGQGGRLSFDRYVMGAAFREILDMANQRLDRISGGRYQLEHSTAADRSNARAGLEIDVLDLATGKRRPSASLSGGEAFYTSLALALGLSDVVQRHAGGMKLEALFIDEGFGTLDDEVLDNALAVLNDLSQGDRPVGIISHVDKLSASIPRKLLVKNGPKGSSIKVTL